MKFKVNEKWGPWNSLVKINEDLSHLEDNDGRSLGLVFPSLLVYWEDFPCIDPRHME